LPIYKLRNELVKVRTTQLLVFLDLNWFVYFLGGLLAFGWKLVIVC
jgi:hypothetical protein